MGIINDRANKQFEDKVRYSTDPEVVWDTKTGVFTFRPKEFTPPEFDNLTQDMIVMELAQELAQKGLYAREADESTLVVKGRYNFELTVNKAGVIPYNEAIVHRIVQEYEYYLANLNKG